MIKYQITLLQYDHTRGKSVMRKAVSLLVAKFHQILEKEERKQREITGKIRRTSIHSNSSIMTIFPTLNGLQKRGNLVGEGISERVVKDMFTQYRLKDRGCTYCVRVCNGHRLQQQRLAHQYPL